MEIRIRETGNIVNEQQFRELFPRVTLPAQLSDKVVNKRGGDIVRKAVRDKPEYNWMTKSITQNAEPTKQGDDWVFGYTVVDLPLERAKANMRGELRRLFEKARDSGVTVSGTVIQTTPQAQSEIRSLLDDLKDRAAAGEVDPTQDIATRSGAVLTVTVAIAQQLNDAVATHIRAVRANDAALSRSINSAKSVAALEEIVLETGF